MPAMRPSDLNEDKGRLSIANREKVHVVTIDDDSEIFGAILRALGPGESLSFQHFLRYEDLLSAQLKRCDVCIIDAFFDHVSLIRKLIDTLHTGWPDAKLIILSNYADVIGSHDRDRVFACIAKPEFLLNPSVLRATTIRAIRESNVISEDLAADAIESLVKVENEELRRGDDVDAIRHGPIYYPLRSPVKVIYERGRYTLEGLSDIAGHADTYADARVAFVRKFHEAFVRLRFDESRTPGQASAPLRQELRRLVDAEELARAVTFVARGEIGEILRIEGGGKRLIRWACGSHESEITEIEVENLPDELLCVERDGYFVGSVVRRVATGEFVRLLHAHPVSTPTSIERGVEGHEAWQGSALNLSEIPRFTIAQLEEWYGPAHLQDDGVVVAVKNGYATVNFSTAQGDGFAAEVPQWILAAAGADFEEAQIRHAVWYFGDSTVAKVELTGPPELLSATLEETTAEDWDRISKLEAMHVRRRDNERAEDLRP